MALETNLFSMTSSSPTPNVSIILFKRSPPNILAKSSSGTVTGLWGSAFIRLPSGKLKALGVTSARRTSIAPEIPTVGEAGLPGLDATAWAGLFVPAGTPAPIVARLNTEVEEILKRADVRERLIAQGVEPAYEPGDRFGESAARDSRRWAAIIRGMTGTIK